MRLDGGLEPQPDLAVLRVGDYREALPGPEDVLLLIEVADTSLAYDREVKLPLYARSGIPEAWLVDLCKVAWSRSTQGRRRRATAPSRKRAGEKPSLPGPCPD